jgi:hypothetical protein
MSEHVEQRAFSVERFAARNGVGRTTAYNEIKEGRLVARKVGNRTIVAVEDESAWLANLPRAGTQAT